MSPLGVYLPGDSPVHRLPAGPKLALLALVGIGTALVPGPAPGAVLVGLVLLAYRVAGYGPALAARQLRPVAPLIVLVVAAQWLTAGWSRAATTATVLVALVLAAVLVGLTTPTERLVDALVSGVRPLRRFGVDPDRVGLQLALGIRAVPLVVELARTIREAQRARGLTADPRAFAVPLIVRSLRRADQLSEALRARGIDD